MRKHLICQVTACRGDERGATLALFALLLVVFLSFAAILVDVGQARASRRDAQSISDMAALGGGESLSVGSPALACQDAVTYVNTNTPDLSPKITASSFCAQSGNNVAQTSCSVAGGLTQAKPTTTVGRYTVTVIYPVLASDIADSNYSGGVGINDGSACQRMGVKVAIANQAIFGGILGNTSIQTSRMAVVKAATTTKKETPSLWLLDPFGCTSLTSTGGSRITVGDTTASPVIPGLITIDSDGTSCSGGQTTITAANSSFITAVPTSGSSVGKISLYAIPSGSTACSTAVHSCDPANVSSGALSPQPKASNDRATRAPVDWKYNCKTGYPAYHGIAIDDCDTATSYPYIDNLSAAIGTSGLPSGFQQWTTAGYSCSPNTTPVVPAGNWWVDCATFTVKSGVSVTFSGNVVFQGDVGGAGILNINTGNPTANLPSACLPPAVVTACIASSSASAAFVYMRGGSLEPSGAINFNHVALVQKGGWVKYTGGASPVWSAPTEGPFKALALWSDYDSNKYQINGGASMALEGVFFTPEARPFTISGGAPVAQQKAQFISRQLTISGGANLVMAPDAQNFVSIPPKAGILIR